MGRILYLYRDSPYARFIVDDRDILRERHQVEEIRMSGDAATFARIVRAAARADLIYFWWGDLTGLAGAALATLLRKPSVMVTGGYDVADVPHIRYGLRYHPWRKFLPPVVLRAATEIVVNAQDSHDRVTQDYGIAERKVHLISHGLDATAITPGDRAKERRVLTCSMITREYIKYKGLDTFVQAAALLPDVPFIHVGAVKEPVALQALQALASPNVQFLGFLSEAALIDEMRRASVYAQLSAHEGFGVALAEAMLAGATPVVTRAGAIPEVAGDVAEYVPYGDVKATAIGIERALDHPRPEQARERIIRCFPLENRRREIQRVVASALGESS